MTVSRFFYEGFHDEEAYKELCASPVFPLVRELEFKHGLKVLRCVTKPSAFSGESSDTYQLVNKNGIAVAKVWMEKSQRDSSVNEYCYRSPFYKKERGQSNADKETIRSMKISSLMATLTRQDVVPPASVMMEKKVKNVKLAIGLVSKSFGSTYVSNPFNSEELFALLSTALGESPETELDVNKCKITLDEYKKASIISRERRDELLRMFTNPFRMIGVDEFGDFLIGVFKMTKIDERIDAYEYEVIEPFKRYKSYEEVPEIIGLMTMVKVAYENAGVRLHRGFPIADKYDTSLQMTFSYNSSPTHYDHLWMVTPC